MSNDKTEASGFEDLGINPSILKILNKLGYSVPTPIQRKAIPPALKGEDIIGIAQTGTGKTLAFGVPMLERLAETKGQGLVLLPTRELAMQVRDGLHAIGQQFGLRSVLLIGGEPIGRQESSLRVRPHIVVATPGRLIDHLERGTVKLDLMKVLVLDEADMMLDMGFQPQVERILRHVPKERQTMLFSATMPAAIVRIAAAYMRLPISIEVAPPGTTAERVEQEVHIIRNEERISHLIKLLSEYHGSVLVFVRTKHGARKLAKMLNQSRIMTAEIHSNLSLNRRQESLRGFKSGKYRVMVGTDIAARGLDINGIELVVNFHLPDDTDDYVHRIGRTGRAGKSGKAISFATPDQYKEIKDIERLIQKDLPLTEYVPLDKPVTRVRSPFGSRSFRPRTRSR